MPTIKSFSVARTQKSYTPGTPTPASGVYALSEGSGRSGAYDHTQFDDPAREGRTPTLIVSGQSNAQVRAPLAANAAGPATGVTLTTSPIPVAAFPRQWPQGSYVVNTINTGAGHTGAGLKVILTVAANGNATVAANAAGIAVAGDGYTTATDDTAILDLGLVNPAAGAITIAA